MIPIEAIKFIIHHRPDKTFLVLLYSLYAIIIKATARRHCPEFIVSGSGAWGNYVYKDKKE